MNVLPSYEGTGVKKGEFELDFRADLEKEDKRELRTTKKGFMRFNTEDSNCEGKGQKTLR